MSERLTAEELAEVKQTLTDPLMWCPTKIPLFRKLLSVSEEAQSLRAAIEKHREKYEQFGRYWDQKLWEALK